jgi:hypothetical protein
LSASTGRAGTRAIIEHAPELDEVIDDLPLSQVQAELLGVSALLTVQLLTDALMDVLDVDPQPVRDTRSEHLMRRPRRRRPAG